MNYLQIDKLSKSYGDKLLFADISFSIDKGQRVALIAKNGVGKTSLLNIIAGNDTADSGNIVLRNGLSVSYLQQNPNVNTSLNVMEQVFASSNEMVEAIKKYEFACKQNNQQELSKATEKMDRLNAWDFEVKVKQILAQLKINNFEQQVNQLSGGQKKRLALANTLINEPDILILDEPTNHLDLEMIEWLEGYMKTTKSTLLMVTHDRYFLDRVCDIIYELDDKQLFRYKGNYTYFLKKREERILNKNIEIDKARALYKKELNWINRMPQARATKAKYRVDEFYKTKQIAEQRKSSDSLNIGIQSTRLGKKIIEIKGVCKKFDDIVILNNFSYNFSRYEKVGVIGKNGTGKTTFLRAITKQIEIDKGSVDVGSTIVFGYYSQEGESFDDNKKVIEVIEDIAEEITVSEGKKMSPLQYLNYFLFPKEMHYAYVNKLSGGERRKLYLMSVLIKNPNFLILDEPTNDLDIVTLNVLEEYLLNFQGCVIIVSHDRYFMDKIVDHLFIFEGNGKVKDFAGDYTLYRQKTISETVKTTKSIKPDKTKTVNKTTEKTKLTYKENAEYEKLTADIDALEKERAGLENDLSSGSLEADAIVKNSKRLNEVIKQIDEKTDRWLELSEFVSA